jgi:G patch domain-containing protein 1
MEADGDGRTWAQKTPWRIHGGVQCRVSLRAFFDRTQDFLTMLRYFNSVGSKEGWTPKTFVSSRANRNKDQAAATAQRAEDFMDDEDLAEAAETRQLETAQHFAGIGGANDTGNDGFFGLLMNPEETMGVKLAQKMGWRRDQGIGRKIARAARLEDGTVAGTDTTNHTFAPEDIRAMPIPREEVRRKGLGYLSEARLGIAEEKPADQGSSLDFHFTRDSRKPHVVKKLSGKKSSFGVGVLNDTGSDDEDPYELGPKISFNKTIGKDKKVKRPSKFAKAGTSDGPVFVSKKVSTKALTVLNRASMDGRPPLAGFVLAADLAELSSKPKYSPPKIPPGWKSTKATSTNPGTQQYQSVTDAAKASKLDAKGRSALLGEQQLPGKSIFDFIPKEARDRLAGLSGKADLPQGRGESGPEGHLPAAKVQPKDLWSLIPVLDRSTAAAALAKGATGWMPYAEDLSKRARYVGFLELRAGLSDDLPKRNGNLSTSDWVKELQEFAHAALVFKPSTGLMASRFTSSSSTTLGSNAGGSTDETLLRQPVAKPEDPAEQAARMGMYGAMTRTSFPFHPSRLLCKRFNVRPPPDMPHGTEPEGDNGSKAKTEEAVSKAAMDKMVHEVLTNGPALQRPAWMGQASQSSAPVPVPQDTGHATVDVEKNEALLTERAPEDVFKSIFGDDDDDDE